MTDRELIEKCDKENHQSQTSRIRVSKHGDAQLSDSTLGYFNMTLKANDKQLLKRFVHTDTYCNNIDVIPAVWRVQGYLCVTDVLDWLESNFGTPEERIEALDGFLENVQLDHYGDKYLTIVEHNGCTYIKVLQYNATHRAL